MPYLPFHLPFHNGDIGNSNCRDGGYVNFRREKNISLIRSSIIYRSSSFDNSLRFVFHLRNWKSPFSRTTNGQKSSKRNNKKNFQRVFFFSPRPNSNTLPPCRPNVFLNSCSMRKGAKERKMRVTRIEFMPPHTPPIYSRVVCSRVFTTHPFASRQKTINTPRKSIICYVNIRRGHSLYHPSRRFFFMDPPLLHQIDRNIIMFVYTACFQHADEILWKSRPNLQ